MKENVNNFSQFKAPQSGSKGRYATQVNQMVDYMETNNVKAEMETQCDRIRRHFNGVMAQIKKCPQEGFRNLLRIELVELENFYYNLGYRFHYSFNKRDKKLSRLETVVYRPTAPDRGRHYSIYRKNEDEPKFIYVPIDLMRQFKNHTLVGNMYVNDPGAAEKGWIEKGTFVGMIIDVNKSYMTVRAKSQYKGYYTVEEYLLDLSDEVLQKELHQRGLYFGMKDLKEIFSKYGAEDKSLRPRLNSLLAQSRSDALRFFHPDFKYNPVKWRENIHIHKTGQGKK